MDGRGLLFRDGDRLAQYKAAAVGRDVIAGNGAVENLNTYFFTKAGVVKAVDGVGFSINRGEILGLVGESGSGKTVTGFSIMGLVDPPGRVVEGR